MKKHHDNSKVMNGLLLFATICFMGLMVYGIFNPMFGAGLCVGVLVSCGLLLGLMSGGEN